MCLKSVSGQKLIFLILLLNLFLLPKTLATYAKTGFVTKNRICNKNRVCKTKTGVVKQKQG
jgi:hypothetical protein